MNVGDLVQCRVVAMAEYGVIVSIVGTPYRGLIYKEEARFAKACDFEEYIEIGDVVSAIVMKFKDEMFCVLSMRKCQETPNSISEALWDVGDIFPAAVVLSKSKRGIIVGVDKFFRIFVGREALMHDPVLYETNQTIDIELTENAVSTDTRLPQAKQIG